MSDVILIVTTTATQDDARKVARTLLEQKLAACVQMIGPIESMYWWKGALETSAEWQCVAKTRVDLFAQAEKAILAVHPYETPEVVAIPASAVTAGYLKWLNEELGP